jgi:SNF2 family DNA or RNA helicase
MTGTPMMNSVDELFPLLRFCKIPPYCEWDRWNQEIGLKLKSQSNSANDIAIKRLQALIRATMLRRTKTSTLDGKPLITLPNRVVEDDGVAFYEDEMEFYQKLQTTSQVSCLYVNLLRASESYLTLASRRR